jgi:alkylhydroperoxidase family enzyme
MASTTLTPRELALLVCASARALGDSYCALAWGAKLAALTDESIAAAVLRGAAPDALTARESALHRWAGRVARDPNAIAAPDVEALREAGLSEREIFEATAFVAFRVAFSTVNDALGARPDRELADAAPAAVRAAITYGRPV